YIILQSVVILWIFRDFDKTPTLSSHPSGQSVDNLVDKITDQLRDSPQSHQTARQALVRDGFRCVVTKAYDVSAAAGNVKMRQTAGKEGAPTAVTQCAHIFPETSGSDEEIYAASLFGQYLTASATTIPAGTRWCQHTLT
ncbi:hypothetical protein BKA83DRAFT_159489, partial [Pisolithus microcarpus]